MVGNRGRVLAYLHFPPQRKPVGDSLRQSGNSNTEFLLKPEAVRLLRRPAAGRYHLLTEASETRIVQDLH